MKTILAVLTLSVLVSVVYAENPSPFAAGKEDFIQSALNAVQQSGDFYYIPFQYNKGYCFDDRCKVEMTQAILETLSRFEAMKKISVATYSVDQVHSWAGAREFDVVRGIFIKVASKK